MNIWELSKRQAKELELVYLSPFFESNGFKLKKTSTSEYDFNKKHKAGRDVIFIGHLEAFPGSKIEFTVMKEINEIESHLGNILRGLDESRNKKVYNASVKFSISSINDLRTNNYMPEMLNEADVVKSCEIVEDFMVKTGFKMLERFNNIKELDREINGENFWKTDWKMPFNLGGDFDIKRIVIAWLAENPNFEEVVNKTYEIMSQNSDGTYYDYDRNDLSLRIPYTVHYLKTLAK